MVDAVTGTKNPAHPTDSMDPYRPPLQKTRGRPEVRMLFTPTRGNFGNGDSHIHEGIVGHELQHEGFGLDKGQEDCSGKGFSTNGSFV